jgi:myo-inositol 2-dehydrogenase / D-chiro-inositol 1-dehydrogenase
MHVGLLGAGRIGAPHARLLAQNPVVDTLTITDTEVGRAAALARQLDARCQGTPEEVVRSGVDVLVIAAAATHDREPPPEDYLAASGGMWRDLLIHDFVVLPWVTGRRITDVYADGTAGGQPFGQLNDVDRAVAVVRFDNGVLGLVSGSRRDPLGYDVRLELLGARDSIAVGVSERVALRSVEPGAAQSTDGYRDFMERFESAYRYELQAFLKRVRDGGESPCSGADARRALCVALAAERSFRERRPVQVEEVG